MPSISNQFDPEGRLLIEIAITNTGVRPGPTSWRLGLIDTGTNVTCIAPSIVLALGLSPTRTTSRASSTQLGVTNLYLGDVHISYQDNGVRSYRTFSSLELNDFTPHPNSTFEMLIGRDILSTGVLTVDGPAKQFNFRW